MRAPPTAASAHLSQKRLLVEKVPPHKHERLGVGQALRHCPIGGWLDIGSIGYKERTIGLDNSHPHQPHPTPPTPPTHHPIHPPTPSIHPPVTNLADDAIPRRHQVWRVGVRRSQLEVGGEGVGAQRLAAVADDADPAAGLRGGGRWSVR
jgi:hypothetical protein